MHIIRLSLDHIDLFKAPIYKYIFMTIYVNFLWMFAYTFTHKYMNIYMHIIRPSLDLIDLFKAPICTLIYVSLYVHVSVYTCI
jgi:hypothetical protein